MTAAEWEKIKALFDAALNVPRAERAAWLEVACAGNIELRNTLEELLCTFEESSVADPRKAEPDPVFSAGQIVAQRFRVLRLIARGGMGEVYEVKDASMKGLRMALKTIRTEIAAEKYAYERFKREVWVGREVAHESICRIYDLVEHHEPGDDGSDRVIPCLTMQLLDGQTLGSLLAAKRPLTTVEAMPLIRQLIEALALMHEKGIVHRDIKPSNIMLVEGEAGIPSHLVIMDFGLAKPLNGDRSIVWDTRTDQRAGAPYFIAPEVLNGDKGGIAVDVYSLGLVIDEIVTRSPAFPHESLEELYWKKLWADPIPPSQRSSGLPRAWEQTILRCLSKNPDERPKTVADVLRGLETEPSDMDTVPDLPVPVTIAAEPPKAARRGLSRRAWLGIGAGCATLPGLAAFVGSGPVPINSSVLVFPFVNLTRQPEYDYLCTGLGDELMRRLIYVDGLKIFPVRGVRTSRPAGFQIARFSVEANLQHHDGRVRLSVMLMENESGALAWSENFERRLDDPLALESEVAEAIVNKLTERVETGPVASVRLAARVVGAPLRRWLGYGISPLPAQATADGTAFEQYLRGRQDWQKRTVDGAESAMKHLRRAVELDPKFALAYSALADVQHVFLTYNSAPTGQLLQVAREYAEKAVALDPELPEVHASLASVRQMLWDWPGAEASYRQAIEVQPKFARGYHWYAGFVLQFGRFDEALALARHAIELDPFDYPSQSSLGVYLWNAGRLREAAEHLERLLAKTDLLYAHAVLGQIFAGLAASTKEPEATEYFVRSLREAGFVRSLELKGANGRDEFLKWSDTISAQAHAARGDRASAGVYIDRLEQGFRLGKISACAVAWAHAAAGNYDRTLELLGMGVELQERDLLYVKVTPLFRPIHGDPRFQAILRRMNL